MYVYKSNLGFGEFEKIANGNIHISVLKFRTSEKREEVEYSNSFHRASPLLQKRKAKLPTTYMGCLEVSTPLQKKNFLRHIKVVRKFQLFSRTEKKLLTTYMGCL